ncbi:hypothetical protein ACS7WQ_06085 [Staphylococcus felis]|uniref:hypothetical protein n=1 Tax=Staphylococcus felis TaxID=46127 RepID=UPI003F41ED5F
MQDLLAWINALAFCVIVGFVLLFTSLHFAHWYVAVTISGVIGYSLTKYVLDVTKKTEC